MMAAAGFVVVVDPMNFNLMLQMTLELHFLQNKVLAPFTVALPAHGHCCLRILDIADEDAINLPVTKLDNSITLPN